AQVARPFRAGVFWLAVEEAGLQEGAGQQRQRIAAGVRDGDLPRGAGPEQLAAEQLRQQSAAGQRRLAAARGPHDRHEAVAAQALQQLDRLFFAAKEQVVLCLGEGPQAGKGIHSGKCRTHAPPSLIRLTKASSSAQGWTSPGWRIPPAWCDWNRSLRRSSGGAT